MFTQMRIFLTANVGIKSRLKFVLPEKYYNRFYNKSIVSICIPYILLPTLFIFPPSSYLLSILLPITIDSEFCKLHISAYLRALCIFLCFEIPQKRTQIRSLVMIFR